MITTSIRISRKTQKQADDLVPFVAQQRSAPSNRSEVLREAMARGLAVLERERAVADSNALAPKGYGLYDDPAKHRIKVMTREQKALHAAFRQCVSDAKIEGVHGGKLWVVWLERRMHELESMKAETLNWLARAILAISEEQDDG